MLRSASFVRALSDVRRAVPRWAWATLATIGLLGSGYALLAAAPALSQRAAQFVARQAIAAPSAAWVDTLLACGATLGGGAALVLVLARLAHEVERRPYACFAPVLAAFSTCVAVGLQPALPLPGVGAEHVAVLVMAATCVGGPLVMAGRLSAQLIGLVLTLFPAFALLLVVWAATGKSDPAVALWSLGSRTLAYLGLLTTSAFAIAVIATLGREVEAARSAGFAPIPDEPTPTARGSANGEDLSFVESLRTRGWRVLRPRLPGWQAAFLGSVGLLLMCGVMKVMVTVRAMPEVSVQAPAAEAAVAAQVLSQPALEPVVAQIAPTAANPGVAASAPVTPPVSSQPTEKRPPIAPPPLAAAAPPLAPRIEKSNKISRKKLRAEFRRQRRIAVRVHHGRASGKASLLPPWDLEQSEASAKRKVEPKGTASNAASGSAHRRSSDKASTRGSKSAPERASSSERAKASSAVPRTQARPPAGRVAPKKAPADGEEESLDALMQKAMGR